jgi:hypothetical protein
MPVGIAGTDRLMALLSVNSGTKIQVKAIIKK